MQQPNKPVMLCFHLYKKHGQSVSLPLMHLLSFAVKLKEDATGITEKNRCIGNAKKAFDCYVSIAQFLN